MATPTAITRFTPVFKPLTNITPFTFRDGYTFLEMYEALRAFLGETLTPEIDAKLTLIYDEVQAQVVALANDVNASKDAWQALFDQFMADVIVELEALNDVAVKNLVLDAQSQLGIALREIFARRVTENPLNYTGTHQDRLNGAVAGAIAEGRALEISEHLAVPGNIPNYWTAFPTGMGSITREGYTFYVTPRPTPGAIQTNHIFVNAQTGVDTNDGLSPSYAFKSVAVAYTQVLRRLTPEQANGAKWVVHLAGQFEGGTKFTQLPEFPYNLVFEGEPVAPNGPVTKISKGASSSTIGMWFEPLPKTVEVHNIWFDGFAVNFNGYGLLGKGAGKLLGFNLAATNCDIGFAAIKNVDYSFTDCETDSTVPTGFMGQYNSSGTWDNCIATGATLHGFFVTRGTVAHIDYSEATECAVGVDVDMSSRVNILETNFKRNAIGVQTRGAGEWVDTDCNFNIGTVDANENNYRNQGVGRESRLYSQGTSNDFHIGDAWTANPEYMNPKVVTGTTSNTVVYAGTALGVIPPDFFQNRDKVLSFILTGKGIAMPFSSTVSIHAINRDGTAGESLVSGIIPGGTVGAFRVEFEVRAKGRNIQLASSKCMGMGANSVSLYTYNKTVDFTNERLFRVYVQPDSASNNVEFHTFDTYLRG